MRVNVGQDDVTNYATILIAKFLVKGEINLTVFEL